jgi:hypothetical protein
MTRAQAKFKALEVVRRWRMMTFPWNAGEPLDMGETWTEDEVRDQFGYVVARVVTGRNVARALRASGWSRDD